MNWKAIIGVVVAMILVAVVAAGIVLAVSPGLPAWVEVEEGPSTMGEDIFRRSVVVRGNFQTVGTGDFDSTLNVDGATTLVGAVTGPAIGTENLRLPTIDSASIITSTDAALWTVGATEVWYIERVFCNVTTNFDCTGDDCTLNIGPSGDADGLLDLDDAELQAADVEVTGLPAGWQGFGSTDTRGALLAAGSGVILANETITGTVGGTSPAAGAATCYVVYTRLQ